MCLGTERHNMMGCKTTNHTNPFRHESGLYLLVPVCIRSIGFSGTTNFFLCAGFLLSPLLVMLYFFNLYTWSLLLEAGYRIDQSATSMTDQSLEGFKFHFKLSNGLTIDQFMIKLETLTAHFTIHT